MIDMFAVRVYEEEIRRSIFKVGKRSNGSDVRRKASPQICPTQCSRIYVLKKSVRGWGRANLFSIFRSPWPVLKGLNMPFRYSQGLIIHSLNININFSFFFWYSDYPILACREER